MTIDEAFGRVIRGHWIVILLCIVAPYQVVTSLSRGEPDVYEAVARVQMGTELAASNIQADATSQRVLGIATSPGVVRSALDKAHLKADAADFAANHIDVRRVGVSPVMEIVVTDTSPPRAAVIARSLTADVIKVSNVGDQPTNGQRRQGVQQKLSSIARQRQQLAGRLNTASPGGVLAIQAQLTSLTTAQAELERQLSDLDLASPSPSHAVLLDPVRQPTIPLPRQETQRAVLAALIGALVGAGLAAALEALRPRLRSSRSIARALEVPHVGHLRRLAVSRRTEAAAGPIADRMALLARRYDGSNVLAVLVDGRDEARARPVTALLGPRAENATHRVECALLGRTWVEPGRCPVVAVLAPRRVKVRDLAATMSFVDALGWPVIGVITYSRGRLWRWWAATRRALTGLAGPREAARVARATAPSGTATSGPSGGSPPTARGPVVDVVDVAHVAHVADVADVADVGADRSAGAEPWATSDAEEVLRR
jgi:capsular polysaccharide biosynthesis protein